jgi:putative nucleotidyltransferase with HDIG domain
MRDPSSPGPADILVADDDPAVRALLSAALGARGHRVREAGNGSACLSEVAARFPDLVLCDLNMPDLDGIEVCRRLKGDETTRHVPFVLITGATDRESRLRGIEAGADDYLAKPLEMAELLARTRALLRTKRLDDEVRRQRQVLHSLLAISTFSPDYAGAPDRLFSDFLHRTSDLLRATHVAVILERHDQGPDVVGCWPEKHSQTVRDKISSSAAMGLLLAQATPVLVSPDDTEQMRTLGLTEGFAGVPIHALDGHVIGAVAAFGIPGNLRLEIFQILMALAQRTGLEVQLRAHSEHLEELVAERTRDLRAALDQLTEATAELEHSHEEMIFRLSLASELRDNETANHLRRMARFTEILAHAAGLPEADITLLRHASLMHDIGKIGIPDEILQKPGRLTPQEYELMKSHTVIGARIFEDSQAPLLVMSEQIALGHHEWWNGQGYPHGRRGEEIPLVARIVAVADVFDALISRRRYKPAWTIDHTFEHLRELAGTQLDPALVETFLRERPALEAIAEILRDPEDEAVEQERTPHALR